MKLSIVDRLTLLQILPQEGDIATIKIVRDLTDRLSFTEAEHKDLNFRIEENRVQWDEDKAQDIDIEIGPKALGIIVAALEKLNNEKKLTVGYIPVYEKFVEAA